MNVLVLGGGIGGTKAAIELRKVLKDLKDVKISLISDKDYLFIYPAAIWVPTSYVKIEDIKLPLKKIAKAHGFDFINEKVISVDIEKRSVTTEKNEYFFDYLVIALGSQKLKNIKGIENTLSICGSAEEILAIKERYEKLLEKGYGKIAFGFSANPKEPPAMRGGPIFEVMFNIDHHLRLKGLRDKFEITFFSPMKEAGKRLGEKALQKVQDLMLRRNIQAKLGSKIEEFGENYILFEDKDKIEADLIIFNPGIGPSKVLETIDLPKSEGGYLKVNYLAQSLKDERVYVVGDSASHEGPEWMAKQGHHAELMAKAAAFNIASSIKKLGKKKTFETDLLCIMDTGDKKAIFIMRKGKKAIAIEGTIPYYLKQLWEKAYKLTTLKKLPITL